MAQTGQRSNPHDQLTALAANLSDLQKQPDTPRPAVPLRQTPRRLSDDQLAELLETYQAGATLRELACQYGIHRTTVASLLARAGVAQRQRGIPPEQFKDTIYRYQQGWSLQRLAERYGCDDETVRQTLKRAGVQLRKPWERR